MGGKMRGLNFVLNPYACRLIDQMSFNAWYSLFPLSRKDINNTCCWINLYKQNLNLNKTSYKKEHLDIDLERDLESMAMYKEWLEFSFV